MDRRFEAGALLFVACQFLNGADAWAQEYDGAVSLTVENDTFTGSDNNYTNGLGISWASNELGHYSEDSLVRRWAGLWSFLPLDAGGSRNFVSWTLAQEMFTPDDITNPNPPLDDQPYAGMLYLDSVIFSRTSHLARIWYLRLGVVGPSSSAEQAQTEIHEVIGADRPMGWDTQFPDEPIINIGQHLGWLLLHKDWGASSFRVIPMANIDLGTYYTGASVFLYNEFGWNLPQALAVSSLRHGLATAATLGAEPMHGWSFSVFVRVGGYANAHYLPLDGTVFKDSRSVGSEPFAGAIEVGFSLRTGRFVLGFQRERIQGKLFKGERQGTEFGTVTMGWYY